MLHEEFTPYEASGAVEGGIPPPACVCMSYFKYI